jgi:hypothetical protein
LALALFALGLSAEISQPSMGSRDHPERTRPNEMVEVIGVVRVVSRA